MRRQLQCNHMVNLPALSGYKFVIMVSCVPIFIYKLDKDVFLCLSKGFCNELLYWRYSAAFDAAKFARVAYFNYCSQLAYFPKLLSISAAVTRMFSLISPRLSIISEWYTSTAFFTPPANVWWYSAFTKIYNYGIYSCFLLCCTKILQETLHKLF